ncbi:DUF1367 family protein [Candidatus Methylospira mobilis]|uniref:DUF1367 family protein n=1 Tax=Candidatus Methylospira mobilis TaxID=1808979 RepID=A0A5Q0BLI3_9GAMM|nr:DUF1367 family protein [Candidatus Methylospira mobilis]QFY42978.1 DUF1367 family protein [Candidatus Methylospira mobilis]
MRVFAIKSPSGALIPHGDEAAELFRSLKVGHPVSVEIKRPRNYRFHKKMFALFKLAFDVWEPGELKYKGIVVEKEFNRFRKDMTILAGFCKPVYCINSEVRLEAESLSYSGMDADRFDLVYRAVRNVVWKHVLQHAGYRSEAEVDRVVNELMGFD